MVARVEITWAKLVAISNWWIQDTDSEEWLLMFWLNTIIDAVESKRWQKRVRAGQKERFMNDYDLFQMSLYDMKEL